MYNLTASSLRSKSAGKGQLLDKKVLTCHCILQVMLFVCIFLFCTLGSVGLSAGTGLGVSSALVQNTGNETPNQDAANNNPPPNQGPNNQAPLNHQGDNENEEENNIGEGNLVGQDAENGPNAPMYGPLNHPEVANPNVGEEMEVDAIENDALNDDHDKPCVVQKNLKCNPKEQNNKNVGNSSEEEGENTPKACCSCDCHKTSKISKHNNTSNHNNNKTSDVQPGPSSSSASGMQLRPRSSAGVVTPKKEDSRRKDKDTGELEQDSNGVTSTKTVCTQNKRRKPNPAEQKDQDSLNTADENNQDNKVSVNEQSKESCKERSETPDGRRSADKEAYASSLGLETKLRRSARLSRGPTQNEETLGSKIVPSPSPTIITPSAANQNSSDHETTSPEPGPRKGKSW